uniref:Uncharacterized protein n=1 Tax=Triticum urartu TaxID=4572 RepID=A0A8R7QI84_TRIUA
MFEEEVIKCWKKKCGTSQCLLHRERHCLCVLHVCVPGVWFCCLFFSCYVLMHLLQCLHREGKFSLFVPIMNFCNLICDFTFESSSAPVLSYVSFPDTSSLC